MVADEIVNSTVDAVVNATSGTIIGNLVFELGRIGKWIQALGLLIILWLGFQIIALIVNRKNRKRIKKIIFRFDEIDARLKRIEGKLNKLGKGKK